MDEHLEMERDAVPPRVPKKRPVVPDFKMEMPSLQEKFLDHFDSRSQTTCTRLPDLFAKVAVPVYFFTITSTWYLGMFEVMPLFYPDEEGSGLLCQRVFMVLIYLEMMVNWLCIRYVDSSYLLYLKHQWTKRTKNGGREEVGEQESLMKLLENGTAYRNENGFHGRGEQDVSPQKNGVPPGTSKTPWKPPFTPSQQTTYPYWSWVPCYVCELMRPPRCHHCPLCQTCVLKRDHHCFFAGSCVGFRNQRHFLIFCAWAFFGSSYASVYGLRYFYSVLWPGMRWFDLFAPLTLVRWILGYVSGTCCLCVWVQSLLIYFIILSSAFVNEHLQLISKGRTSFEVSSLKKTVELRDSRKLGAKFRSVLGKWWLLNLLLPLHWIFEAQEDPENWPSIKVYRH